MLMQDEAGEAEGARRGGAAARIFAEHWRVQKERVSKLFMVVGRDTVGCGHI